MAPLYPIFWSFFDAGIKKWYTVTAYLESELRNRFRTYLMNVVQGNRKETIENGNCKKSK